MIDITDFAYTLPRACVEECTTTGSNDSAVAWWANVLECPFSNKTMRGYLKEVGAWDDYEVDDMSVIDMFEKIIWLCAWDSKDNGYTEATEK